MCAGLFSEWNRFDSNSGSIDPKTRDNDNNNNDKDNSNLSCMSKMTETE